VHNFGTCVWRTAAQWRLPEEKVFGHNKNRILPLRWSFLVLQLKLCTDIDLILLYVLILGTYSKCARKNNFPALGVCFPQPWSSAGRRFATSRSRLQNYWRIVSFPQQKFRRNALWTEFHWESAFVRKIPNPTLSVWKVVLLPALVNCKLKSNQNSWMVS